MAHTNQKYQQETNEPQDRMEEVTDILDGEGGWEEKSTQSKQLLDIKRTKIRKSIEEIKERKRLKELLGDDLDDLDS